VDISGARFIIPGDTPGSRLSAYANRNYPGCCESRNPGPLSKFLVRAIAQHAVATVLAAAKIYCFRFACLIFDGVKFTALVAAITERLGGAFAAGAPPVAFAGFYLNGKRGFLSDNSLLV
jgi:hypothetical protein